MPGVHVLQDACVLLLKQDGGHNCDVTSRPSCLLLLM